MAAVLNVGTGAIVTASGRAYCVRRFDNPSTVIARDLQTGIDRRIDIKDLTSSSSTTERYDLADLPEEQWALALERYRLIGPLLDTPHDRKTVAAIAQREGVGVATLYRWMKAFRRTGIVSALVRKRRSDAGEKRMDARAEKIMARVLATRYLKSQKINVKQAYREVERLCRRQGIPIPHENTFKQRVRALPAEKRTRAREGENAALSLRPIRGSLPGADHPYSIIQIDHTRADVMLVDEVHRLPIGRPWITVAIDVFSRMVVGWYVSFDPPGTLGTGMCIANAILPKEPVLAALGVDFPWPCQGRPAIIHLDNANEFRGTTLGTACQEWRIDLRFRKVKKPNYGGHIERLLGTLLTEMHALPGSTFSNPKDRENYDSEAKAAMTLREFEAWLSNLILGAYHHRVHSALSVTPLKRHHDGILGSDTQPGIGALPIVTDAERLRIDFLPYELRTVQPYGIQIDGIYYYADVLQRWIGARDTKNVRAKRKFIVRRDPRDISYVLFYDPDARRHFRIPYRDLKHPPMSLWELRAVQRYLADQGKKNCDEATIFTAFNRMREIEEKATTLTRSQRLKRERRRQHRASVSILPAEERSALDAPAAYDPRAVAPFDEIEEM